MGLENPSAIATDAAISLGQNPSHSDFSVWDEICVRILRQIGSDTFHRCFSGTSAYVADGCCVVVNVPSQIQMLWIESNFSDTLADAAVEILGPTAHIKFRIGGQTQPAPVPTPQSEINDVRGNPPKRSPSRSLASPHVTETSDSLRSFAATGLNPKFNFDSFVVGSNCSYSAAVARAVAEKPGRIYNPLFFYGATGLGKTHLMQAIGQEVQMRKKKAIVRYVTSEQFTNEFVEAIKKQSFTQFRQKYRKVDVLLIDDVHFFAGKDSTQEEFFHTFNELFNSERQIVLASDRPPSEIKNLESRLVSRFEWGLTAQIQTPDFETRVAILRRKMSGLNVALDPWILEFIAQRVRTNVRKLEGALMRVAAYVSLEGGMQNESTLGSFLQDLTDEAPISSITVDRVQRAVASKYELRVSDLTGPHRLKNIVEARQVAMYLTRQLVKLPLFQIGEEFGGRNASTVVHALKAVRDSAENNDFRNMLTYLENNIIDNYEIQGT